MSDDTAATGFVMDRNLQRDLLEKMRTVYPESFRSKEIDDRRAIAQIAYLDGHGLCDGAIGISIGGPHCNGPAITLAGFDFLEQDGGLGAILGVVTIKLHADTIRDLLAAKVDTTDLPQEKKSAIKEQLRKLSGTALQATATDLVKLGLDHLPDATHLLHTLAGFV